jgi:hypothetical protein
MTGQTAALVAHNRPPEFHSVHRAVHTVPLVPCCYPYDRLAPSQPCAAQSGRVRLNTEPGNACT